MKEMPSIGFFPGRVNFSTWRTDPSPQTIRSALSSLRSSRVSSAPASAATRVRSSFMRIGSLPSTATSVHTPGHGVKARTRLCSVRAEWRARSACASSALILSALVALASSCGVSAEAQLSSHTEGSDSTSRRVPRSKSSSSSSGACSDPSKGRCCCLKIGPASILSTVKRTLTPLTSSPASKHLCSGAAPRYSGSSDGCMLRVPFFGKSRNRRGRKQPYAAVIHRSGSSVLSSDKNSSSLASGGVSSFRPCSVAS
mmetsp:Transcript_2727/g.5811  ORF Transcript_2727/g.5811 Transcript_2727/m.5811 type:complete len:256 (-) Transcript_2727:45-812(-)